MEIYIREKLKVNELIKIQTCEKDLRTLLWDKIIRKKYFFLAVQVKDNTLGKAA